MLLQLDLGQVPIMEERVPLEFFTPELLARVAAVLCKLSPPGDVYLMHLDEPRWFWVGVKDGAIVMPEPQAPTDVTKIEPPKGPIFVDAMPTYEDRELSLSGGKMGEGIIWMWRGGPRFSLNGHCPVGVEWNALRDSIRQLAPVLSELLTYRS